MAQRLAVAGPVMWYLEAIAAVQSGAAPGVAPELEHDFEQVAARYSRMHGLTAEAWLIAGVSALVLERAGILG